MPRVLFVAYDFPPGAGIGAGLRSAYFARYLPDFGWQPSVIALDGGQAAAEDIVRLSSPTPWHRHYKMTPYGWAYALAAYLRRSPQRVFDLVYVSCPPFPQALSAARYAAIRDLPLVVDFRDAWTLDPYQEGSRLKRGLYRHLFPVLEKYLLSKAELLILNTPSALTAYRAAYPAHADRMIHLPNGYDEEAFAGVDNEPPGTRGAMQLLHAGRFGIGGRSPAHLLAGIKIAQTRGCRIRLDILGQQSPAITAMVDGAGLGEAVQLPGEVSYAQAIQRMPAADVLVLIQAPSLSPVQAVAGKTFDYLRSGRPVLVVAPEGDNLDLVRDYAPRYERAEDTADGIAAAIMRLYAQWQSGALARAAEPDPGFVARFERRALSATLADHFDRLLARKAD